MPWSPSSGFEFLPLHLRAIIFDFNGVLVDDETPHLRCFQQALAEQGLALTKQDYYDRYLGMDERTCAEALLTHRDGRCDAALHQGIMERKASLFREYTKANPPPLFPGAVEFVKRARESARLAIASGGRRDQLAQALHGTLIEHDFELIVSAEDVPIGKPDPAIYRVTLDRLNQQNFKRTPIIPQECVVLEDSLAGIRSAISADMWVVALSTTYPADRLAEAHCVVSSLEHIMIGGLLASLER